MWERVAGQVLQVALTVLALILLPSPLRPFCPVAVAAGLVVGSAMWWLRRRGATERRGFVAADVRALLDRRTASRIALASSFSTAAHLTLFLVAVRAVGVHASLTVLVPTALVVLVASSVPVSIAGWGPREGVTAWAFGYAGLGAGNGPHRLGRVRRAGRGRDPARRPSAPDRCLPTRTGSPCRQCEGDDGPAAPAARGSASWLSGPTPC